MELVSIALLQHHLALHVGLEPLLTQDQTPAAGLVFLVQWGNTALPPLKLANHANTANTLFLLMAQGNAKVACHYSVTIVESTASAAG